MKPLRIKLLLLLPFLLFSVQNYAAVYTWIGPNNASFSASNNFMPARLSPSNTDTIIITGGLGGDTIITPAGFAPSNYQYWSIGKLIISNNRIVTFHCKVESTQLIYRTCLEILGVAGQALQIDSNCTLNIYGNGNEIIGQDFCNLTIGGFPNPCEARINGRLTINTTNAPPSSNGWPIRAIYLNFMRCKVVVNGEVEILSSSPNFSGSENLVYFTPANFKQFAKFHVFGSLIYSGGSQRINFGDSMLQVEPTGRVILNFPANATLHNLKGVYKSGSQVIINGHPGSDTALITLPDSIHHLIINTNGNTRPLHLVARSNLNDSLVPILIKGNVTINKTGTNSIEFNTANNNKSTTILGNVTLNDGSLQIRNYGNSTTDTGSRVFIKGNYLQNGGTLNFIGTHPKVGQLFVQGNLFQYNGFIKNTSGSLFPQIVLNGTDTQRLRLRATIDDSITFVLNNPSGFILDSNLVLGAGSTIEYINGTLSGPGSVVYASPSSVLLFSNPSQANPSNNLWSASQAPYQVVLQNTAPLTLTGSKQIRNSLIIGKGKLILAPSDSLTVGNINQMANVIQTGDGYVQGKLSLWVGAQTGTYTFPLGLNGKLKTIELQYTNSPNTPGTLSANYTNLLPGNLGLPLRQGMDSIVNTVGEGYWTIQSGNNLSGGIYSLKVLGSAVSGVSDIQNIRLVKRTNSSTAWLAPGIHGSVLGKIDSFYVSRTALIGFSDFAFAQKLTTLSIGNNVIGSNQTLCQGNAPSLLQGSLPINGTGNYAYLWLQSTTSSTGNYVPASGINSAQNYLPSAFLGSVWYKRVVFSGTEVDSSNAVLVQTEPKLKVGFTVNKQIQCLNDNQFVFTDTTQGNANRLWVYGNGQTANTAVLTISYTAGPINSHSVKLYGSLNGNCVDSTSQTVYVNTNPITGAITGDTIPNLASTKVYEVPSRLGSNYTWIFAKGAGNSTTNQIQIQWTSLGLDQLKVIETANTGCVGDTVFLNVNISPPSGISILSQNAALLIYPNPSNEEFFIDLIDLNFFEIEKIELFNCLGELINSNTQIENKKIRIKSSEFLDGIYYVKLVFKDGSNKTGKILVRH